MKPEIKNRVLRRLKILEGQARGIQDMVGSEQYCVEIITQIEAVREALSGVGQLILRNHLETHIMHQIKHGEEKKAAAEILKIYQLAQK